MVYQPAYGDWEHLFHRLGLLKNLSRDCLNFDVVMSPTKITNRHGIDAWPPLQITYITAKDSNATLFLFLGS
jgi:hypothetical protein